MNFIAHVLRHKQDNFKALGLFAALYLFYMAINVPYINFMETNAPLLAEHNPFYGKPFTLNLFNFDPSMYYGFANSSVIHPFLNYVSGPLSAMALRFHGNLFFLAVQSAINGLSAVMIYYYLRKSGSSDMLAILFAAFFGVSSYCIFTAMIPDSYPYVQCILVLSVLFMQYARDQGKTNVWMAAALALCNFGATSTNIVPYFVALFFTMLDKHKRNTYATFAVVVFVFMLSVVSFTVLQFALPGGRSWITTWFQGLQAGGLQYVAPFSFRAHWQAVYMLAINPVLTPEITLIDPGIVAFVTDVSRPYPWYTHAVGFSLMLLVALGVVRGIRSKEIWALVPYLFFAFLLHIVVGFGLYAFTYDMYLYAGHYLFVFFLIAARAIIQIRQASIRKTMICVVLAFLLITLGNNMVKHTEALNYIEKSYMSLSIEKSK